MKLRKFNIITMVALLCAGSTFAVSAANGPHPHTGRKGSCDDRIAMAFKLDKNVTVLLVKPFAQGDAVALANSPGTPPPAPVDLCLVKLVVGPGNPGPEGAPSTSPGIGIEIWLPDVAAWNGIIRNYGSGGFAGGYHVDVTRLSNTAPSTPIIWRRWARATSSALPITVTARA